jgi:RloB-like protein
MSRRNRRRRESALRRQRPTRRPRECILVVCEGTETEPNYLMSLRKKIGLSTVEVEIVGEGAEILRVVGAAIRLREERLAAAEESNRLAPFDEVWCVVDTERKRDNPSWERGVDRARANSLKVAWSNPCFDQLAPRIPKAIENSKQIHRSQWQDTPKFIDCNPATTVHELVEKLIQVAGMTIEQYQARYPLPDPAPPKGKRMRWS